MPRGQADFGDGGAFPEIHAAQFPLEMGRPAQKKAPSVGVGGGGGGVGSITGLGVNAGSTAIVAVDVDETGKVKNDISCLFLMFLCLAVECVFVCVLCSTLVVLLISFDNLELYYSLLIEV